MEANNNTKGILFIMIGMAFFSIQDSLIKYIFEEIALFELYQNFEEIYFIDEFYV